MGKYRMPESLDKGYGDHHLPIGRHGLSTKKRSVNTDSGKARPDATRSSSAGTQSTSKVRKAKAEDKRKREEIKRSGSRKPSAKLDAPEKDRGRQFDPEVEIESARGTPPPNEWNPLSPANLRKAAKEKKARDRRKKGN